MSSNLAEWQLHGPVQTVRREIAEWDWSQQAWRPSRHFNSASFDPVGRIREVKPSNVERRTIDYYGQS